VRDLGVLNHCLRNSEVTPFLSPFTPVGRFQIRPGGIYYMTMGPRPRRSGPASSICRKRTFGVGFAPVFTNPQYAVHCCINEDSAGAARLRPDAAHDRRVWRDWERPRAGPAPRFRIRNESKTGFAFIFGRRVVIIGIRIFHLHCTTVSPSADSLSEEKPSRFSRQFPYRRFWKRVSDH